MKKADLFEELNKVKEEIKEIKESNKIKKEVKEDEDVDRDSE